MSLIIEDIFKESTLKLNQMIAYLDSQLGTNSLSKDEVQEVSSFIVNTEPVHMIDPENKIVKSKKNTGKESKTCCGNKGKVEDTKEIHLKTEEATQGKNKQSNENKEKQEKKSKTDKTPVESTTNSKKQQKPTQKSKKVSPESLFQCCDLRVGFVKSCKILENFNDIYELIIDLGEENPRVIGTGLRHYVPEDKIQGTKVIVFSNLKPKKFGDSFASNGMIMCASKSGIGEEEIGNNPEGSYKGGHGSKREKIELIRPNSDAKVGEKVFLEGMELDKKKEEVISGGKFGKVIEYFMADGEGKCRFDGKKMMTESGEIRVETLKNAKIS